MENEILVNDYLQEQTLNKFLKILIIDLADKYLDNLKKYKSGDTSEVILKFLDPLIFLLLEKIELNNIKIKQKIVKMSTN